MSETTNNLIIYNGYPLSVVVAVTIHSLLLAGLLYFQVGSRTEVLELVQPTVIKALFIDENPQVKNERQRIERRDQQVARDRERQQERDAEAERQRQEQARAQEQERAQREERDRSALVERQEQDRLRAEAEIQQRERELEDEARRRRELAETDRQQEVQDRAREQAKAAEEASAEGARTEFELVQSATAIIQQAVQSSWSRPPSARNGMRAILQIRMLPTGELIDATITQSSGDPAFDRSAENAVYRAAPFRELQSLPTNVFTANFRTLSLIFQPEDLLN
ncbi:MAG: hypothetical protein COA96_00015 [SAR86 cluster bacterium]|uniref:Protein TolA n=1 Tax=SAR86 cluster bacterium TaxID=2030880 RepID=A0A2A5BAS6_9GAMM|nr:MAG: hypothetical protein COA96_00015 [SAR86 cluster bacterium]